MTLTLAEYQARRRRRRRYGPRSVVWLVLSDFLAQSTALWLMLRGAPTWQPVTLLALATLLTAFLLSLVLAGPPRGPRTPDRDGAS
jgi:hypothetical protein